MAAAVAGREFLGYSLAIPSRSAGGQPQWECDPESVEDWGRGRGQSSSEGSPRSPLPGIGMASAGPDQAHSEQ